jgi:hypothetical protein
LQTPRGDLDAAAEAQLGEDVAQVRLRDLFGDCKHLRDLAVSAPTDDEVARQLAHVRQASPGRTGAPRNGLFDKRLVTLCRDNGGVRQINIATTCRPLGQSILRACEFARLLELPQTVLSNRPPYGESRRPIVSGHVYQRLSCEVVQEIPDLDRLQALICADPLRVCKCEVSFEDGESPQKQLLIGRQKPMAPVNGCPDGPLPLRCRARLEREQAQRVFEAVASFDQRHAADAGSGELDSQRHSVAGGTDPGSKRLSFRLSPQVRVERLSAFEKESDSLTRQVGMRFVRPWDCQRWDAIHPFPWHANQLATGGQDSQAAAPLEQKQHKIGTWCDDVLAVIQNKDQFLVTDRC